MSELVLGFGSSHGPLLSTPPEEWDLRANVDRRNPELTYLDGTYNFEQLLAVRKDKDHVALNALGVRQERYARCQRQLDALADQVAAARPDVIIVIGDDQEEWFGADIQPAFAIYHGKTVVNRALTPEEVRIGISKGTTYSQRINHPPQDEVYPCATELAERMIAQAMEDDFDVTSCGAQPRDGALPRKLGHAFGFIYRRIVRSRPIPMIPVLINTYYPPNQPSAKRCYAFGRSMGRAIRAWKADARVAVAASGGVSHFVIDEAFDARILEALQRGDERALLSEPEYMYRSGTSETKNWIAAAGALAESTLRMQLLDYVPCYRSEAGTGNAMAFAVWK
jgi:OH-DDVA oxygenase/3-O-methylgallate 3,4-dioxygenase